MTNPDTSVKRSRFRGLLGLAVGFLVAGLLFVDPFHLHPVDEWIGQRLHGGPTAPAAEDFPEGTLWTCGMHPQVIQEEPGFCPICNMALVPIESGAAKGHEGHDHVDRGTPQTAPEQPGEGGEREILFYRNPMDPTITSPVPAKDEMGMDYVPVYADQAAASQGAVVTLDPGLIQSMNVRTQVVERRDLVRRIRTVGYLDYDQQRMVTVTTKYSGWVEKVYVNYIGEPVRKGQPLFEIYSPELVQTQQELLTALEFARRMAAAPEDARRRAEELVDAARRRLDFWDIDAERIAVIERGGQPLRTLPVTAPASGVVMKRVPGLQGMAVQPGMELFHIADLTSLWLSVEVFEDQLAWLRQGSTAKITLDYFPGETFQGRVRFIEPEVSEETRTVSLRLEVPNRDGRLRAGMYATVTFEPSAARDAVAVPSLAVLRTGERDVVVIALGDGRFAPREVRLGVAADGWYQVLEGLEAGERVVTSAQFLIDSESHLREAILKMVGERREG
jgi:Cu(I)/Ag(I) efflux system membrane fusion protein/cobalt-zinc-cadmium efflux system membrane fusion protein